MHVHMYMYILSKYTLACTCTTIGNKLMYMYTVHEYKLTQDMHYTCT